MRGLSRVAFLALACAVFVVVPVTAAAVTKGGSGGLSNEGYAASATGIAGTDVITTYAGTGAGDFNGDGIAATTANIAQPIDIEVDGVGNLYIAEQLGNRVRMVSASTGTVSTVAGTGTAGSSGDGGAATDAQLAGVTALALDGAGNLYIGENDQNYVVRVRKVAAGTGTITTVLNMGPNHFISDAEIGPDGRLYFSDSLNNVVLKLDTTTAGAVPEIVAGTGSPGSSGDGGPATAAELNNPAGLAFDATGNLYIADYFGHRVRRVDALTQTITTAAGTGEQGGGGDGGPATLAQLNTPASLAFDSSGNLYIGEWNGYKVRKVEAVTGVITTVAGNGTSGFSGDGGPATEAQLNTAAGLTLDSAGLYISDTYNYRIRRVQPAAPPNVVTNTYDSGPGSLRAAIEFANANPGPDTISFEIPMAIDPGFNGQWFTIRPLSALPDIHDDGTTIDGSTQTLFTGDTNPAGPEIELNGSLAPGARGLALWIASDSRIDSLAVNSFSGGAIQIQGTGNVVTHSYVGTDAAGTITGNVGVGIQICCSPSSRDNRVVDNLIRGNRPGMILFSVDATVVQGNRIELSGPQPAPPGCGLGVGILVSGSGNLIGGTGAGEGNLISGNGDAGIFLQPGSSGTTIQGNLIGTNATGSAANGNHCGGIGSFGAPTNTLIGGTAPGARNVISGNGGAGISIGGTGTVVQGNYIGTNAAGTAAIPNGSAAPGDAGVLFNGATDSAIRGNLISGNNGQGIQFLAGGAGTSNNSITGNLIGTTASGTAALPNTANGVYLLAGSSMPLVTSNVIGGADAADRNVIAGNLGQGIIFNGGSVVSNTIRGNHVGLGADGTTPLGNGANGIHVEAGAGGAPADNRVEGNTVAYSSGAGVVVNSGIRNAVSRNSIFSNGGLGIDLGAYGVAANDPGDADAGPNNLQNYPVLTQAVAKPVGLTVEGTIDTPNPQTVTIELFSNPAGGGDPSGFGEGKTFLGTATPQADGSFTVTLPAVPAGTLISATATDAAGNTSEFAANIAAKGAPAVPGPPHPPGPPNPPGPPGP